MNSWTAIALAAAVLLAVALAIVGYLYQRLKQECKRLNAEAVSAANLIGKVIKFEDLNELSTYDNVGRVLDRSQHRHWWVVHEISMDRYHLVEYPDNLPRYLFRRRGPGFVRYLEIG